MTRGRPVIPGYTDVRLLGRGGFAVVYGAIQVSFDREVAVKVVDRPADDDQALGMFQRECQAIGKLSWHPHVVPVYDAGETEDGRPYLTMELLPGGSVADVIETGPLDHEVAAAYGAQVADAVAAAHDVGVLHRDLKPANVLIDRRGVARLADFGIARIVAESTTMGAISGTVAFMAPELLSKGKASVSSDVYGIGITVASMVIGRNPFVEDDDQSPFASIQRVLSDVVPDLREFGAPDALALCVARCTAKDPLDRPGSAVEVQEMLEAVAIDASTDERPSTAGPARDDPCLVTVPVPRSTATPPRPSGGGVPPAGPPDDPADDGPTPAGGDPRRPARGRRIVLVAGIVVSAVLLAAAGFALSSDDDSRRAVERSDTTEATTTSAEAVEETAPGTEPEVTEPVDRSDCKVADLETDVQAEVDVRLNVPTELRGVVSDASLVLMLVDAAGRQSIPGQPEAEPDNRLEVNAAGPSRNSVAALAELLPSMERNMAKGRAVVSQEGLCLSGSYVIDSAEDELQGVVENIRGDGVPIELVTQPHPADDHELHVELLQASMNRALGDQAALFVSGSAALSPESEPALTAVAEQVELFPDVHEKVVVEGHTDNEGPRDVNIELSLARARAVRDALVARGVDGARLEAIGHGPDQPIADNSTEGGRAANRRVVFNVGRDHTGGHHG